MKGETILPLVVGDTVLIREESDGILIYIICTFLFLFFFTFITMPFCRYVNIVCHAVTAELLELFVVYCPQFNC